MSRTPEVIAMDLEGVLVPEIWIAVAEKTGIEKLRLTTRDVSDYDQLMKGRLEILKKNGLRLKDIQEVINSISPLPGAGRFLDWLRPRLQVSILSDTFYEFAMPLMKKLN
ncbi:MAG: bifunctional phosphoserine phosphatase/homoserine phosphotransferase ThrH, partial [Spirochaetota bacterium]